MYIHIRDYRENVTPIFPVVIDVYAKCSSDNLLCRRRGRETLRCSALPTGGYGLID
ncbi:uncharacterized protein PHACADRAFT_262653 [Phanerochaete carnosa HHB-10118-sp]|uniref:Uncharacterized protein n=1 Tax=Phanerochaete carnosa (strain HHB-10118-sp) TaxID=650164 RepID=K5UQN2_PHACS|nr:uncharacterized protein PHACADRAFT_262653 [Phanerochaete carnosa HHB-10118-sp]EKM52141.1 hypothetical protein PHACADRAFT_262653 [Phanerochaete carnosa HHB-10118-sp]